jgi:hypothetical protein
MHKDAGTFYEIRFRLRGRLSHHHWKLGRPFTPIQEDGVPWAGHDFIDAIESDSNWEKVKAFLKETGMQLTIETIKYAIGKLFGASAP